jgi:hypothetical protein
MRIQIDTEQLQIPTFHFTSFDVYCCGAVVLIVFLVWLYIVTKLQTKQLSNESKAYLAKKEGYELGGLDCLRIKESSD